MTEHPNNENADTVDFALMDQLVEDNPELTDQEILALYQQQVNNPQVTVALISDDLNDATKVILASALPEPKQPESTHSQAQYQIDHKIDSGGQSHVYLAHRNDGTYQKTVVIKVLNQSIEGNVQKQQLMAEMQILADLNHPHIVKILDAGIDDQQRPWMMLDYIQGEHIDQFIETNCLTKQQWLALASSLAKALRYIHDHQVVHADIKPANILVSMDDGVPNPTIIDFGIASTRHTDADHSPYIFATPAFAAPEQLDNSIGTVDHRSDIFSYGRLLQCLIETHNKSHQQSPLLNTEFHAVIAHCLHVNPTDRYQDTLALVKDTEQLKCGGAVSVVQQTPISWLTRYIKQHRMLSFVALLVMTTAWLLISHVINQSKQNQALVQGAEASQYYWQSAEEISNQLRLIYALPKRNIENDFKSLNNQYDALLKSFPNESTATKQLSYLPLAEAGISLGRFNEAQELLLMANQSNPNDTEIQFKLGKNYLLLYQNEVQQLQNISSTIQRQTQRARLKDKYFTPALKLFNQSAYKDPMVSSLLAYFDGKYTDALAQLQAANSQLLWPIERLILMAQIGKEYGNDLFISNQPQQALEQFYAAELNLKKAVQIARSHPEAHRQMCQIENLILQFETKQVENHISSCDAYLELLPNNAEAILVVADAYTQLAKSWLTDGHAPAPLIEHARKLLAQQSQQQAPSLNNSQQAHAEQLLGNLFSIEGKWQLFSNQQFSSFFEQAIEHHQNAVQQFPSSYTAQLDLATAWYNLGNNTQYQHPTTDKRFSQATEILTGLTSHADSTEYLAAFLVRVLTDHAYIRYQNGHAADAQLNLADNVVQQLQKEAPESVYAQLAIATLYWTYTDYLVLQNKNPTDYLPQAIQAFDQVIHAEPDQWTNRYNQISAMLSGATYFLNQDQVQTEELQAIEDNLTALQSQISDDISLASHYGYFHNLKALNHMLLQQKPAEQLDSAYQHNFTCADSPIDGTACMAELAHSMVIEAAWNLTSDDRLIPNQLVFARVEQGLLDNPNNQQLLVRLGTYHWLQSQQPKNSKIKQQHALEQALIYLNQACDNNNLLAAQYRDLISDIEAALKTPSNH